MGLAAVTWRYCVAQARQSAAHQGRRGGSISDPALPLSTQSDPSALEWKPFCALYPGFRFIHRSPPCFLNGIPSSPYLLRFSARQDTYPGCWY